MIENIKNEFKIILAQSEWMDDESKEKALDKVNIIIIIILIFFNRL